MPDRVTVALVQMSCGESPQANLDKAIAKIDEAARRGAEIVCLQELFRSRYFCQSEDIARFDLAEPIPGLTTAALGKLAAARKIVIIGALFERRDAGIYHNTAVVIDRDGEIAGRYRKMHIPDDPGYYEKFYFTPGDLDFVAHQTSAGKLGVLVCWDQWFPEAARLTAMSGAQILFYPTAIGWSPDMNARARSKILDAWRTAQRAHAIANGVYVAAINRAGTEGGLQFWGHSFIADPFGELIAEAGEGEETLIAQCELGKIEETRRNWPFLRDRRIDAYGDLVRRFRSLTVQSTPAIPRAHRDLMRGYRMPAEWASHRATYLVWPHNLETWPGKFESIPPIFAMLAAAIAGSEPVRILVNDADQIDSVRVILQTANARLDRIELLAIPSNDSWIRDTGPIFVNRGAAQIAIGWKFNSWGEKYGSHERDDAIVRRLGERYSFDLIEPGIVLEGGSIDVNGAGTLITTEACLLNKNRNPHLDRVEIEDFLCTYLGVSNVLWFGDGIVGDDTDGHVDDLARFVAPDTIVTMVEDDTYDANHAALRDNLARLRAMRDQDGRPLRIETLPMPPALFCEGTRLPASYANFYITNGAVIVPTFGCPQDEIAMATLARLFAGRRVVGIPSVDLVLGLGAIHCLTQQHPVA